jgi:hypothetical protein
MRRIWLASLVVLASAGLACAQTTEPSDNGAAPTPDQMLNEMLNHGGATTMPTTQPQDVPVLRPAGYTAPAAAPQLLREGSNVIARSGHLQKVPDSAYSLFVFDNKPTEPALQAMLVLPNLQLMSMEDALAATREDLKFTVSGTVTEYKGRNYILLEPGPEDLNRQILPTPLLDSGGHGPVSADQMLNQMLSVDSHQAAAPAALKPPETDLTSGSGAVAPAAPVLAVLQEQSQIIDRVARLSHSADGTQEEITLESDGSTMQDPPLILLPNLKLTAIEGADAGDTHDQHFRVSGIVTEYRGRNYILLQKVVVMADADRQF